MSLYSWGKLAPSQHKDLIYLNNSTLDNPSSSLLLPYGSLRSYGDEAYNDGGILLSTKCLNKFINFDRDQGYLTVQSGVTLEQILSLIVPCGWFLAVTPGTKYITVGGAIANDVHGKNHHKVGSFGVFVTSFELLRSNGERLICSPTMNSEYFYATIGGMGLTGVIICATFKLIKINNHAIISTAHQFSNLAEYFSLNSQLENNYTYTVAWIDCLSKGKSLGRGVYFTGEHAGYLTNLPEIKSHGRNFPFTPKISLVNKLSLSMFNSLYYNIPRGTTPQIVPYDKFFYPLDKINNWNKMYGKRGFYQYQFVIPNDNAYAVISEVLGEISSTAQGSFLAVLKTFGNISSGGMMSFCRPGVSFALDFANQGSKTDALFEKLDCIIKDAGGAIYTAKDSRQTSDIFKAGYPRLNEFIKYIDPKFSSNMWRRLNGN